MNKNPSGVSTCIEARRGGLITSFVDNPEPDLDLCRGLQVCSPVFVVVLPLLSCCPNVEAKKEEEEEYEEESIKFIF